VDSNHLSGSDGSVLGQPAHRRLPARPV